MWWCKMTSQYDILAMMANDEDFDCLQNLFIILTFILFSCFSNMSICRFSLLMIAFRTSVFVFSFSHWSDQTNRLNS